MYSEKILMNDPLRVLNISKDIKAKQHLKILRVNYYFVNIHSRKLLFS